MASPPGELLPFIGTRFETLTSLLKQLIPDRCGSFRQRPVLQGENAAPRGCRSALQVYTSLNICPNIPPSHGWCLDRGHAMSLRRCAVQRRTHRMRSAKRKIGSLWQCVLWIVDQMRVGRSCRRLDGWTSPARCSAGLLAAREAASAPWVRCPGRAGTDAELGSGRYSSCGLRNSAPCHSSEVRRSAGRTRESHRSPPSLHSCSHIGWCGAITGSAWPPRVCKCWKSRSKS